MVRKRFVFISHCRDIEFFDPVKQGMNDAAKLMDVDVSFVGTDDIDVDGQKALLQKAIADGVDGIATTITHETAFDGLVFQALEKGIPVVCFNTDASRGKGRQLASIVQNTYAAGLRLGNFMVGRMEDGAKALITLHSDGIDSLESRKKGILDALAGKNPEWEFLTTGNGSEEARKRVAQFLGKHPDIRFVFGTGQDDTVGAGQAAMDLGTAVTVCGFDLSPATKELIRQGHVLAAVDQQPYMQGFYPVLQLCHHIDRGLDPSDMDAGSNIITKDKQD